jgi:hypothetical protein
VLRVYGILLAAGCSVERLQGEIPCDLDGHCPAGFHCQPCSGECPPRTGRCALGETGPRMTWLSPGDRVGRRARFEVSAEDPDGVAEVAFRLGGREVGRATAAPWAVERDLDGFDPGPARLVAEATDGRGTVSRAERDAVVDLTPPAIDASKLWLLVDSTGTRLDHAEGAVEEGALLHAGASRDALSPCTGDPPCRVSDLPLRDAWVQAYDRAGNASAVARVPEVRVVVSTRPPGAIGARAVGTAQRPAPAAFGGDELLATELSLAEDADAVALTVAAGPVGLESKAAWIERTPGAAPSLRCGAALAWHTGRARVVLYGGDEAPCPDAGAVARRSDTWAWDGASWERLAGGYPIDRSGAAIASVALGVFLHGGRTTGITGELYEMGDALWIAKETGPARQFGCLAADEAGTAVQFGGLGPSGASGETWRYRFTEGWTLRTPGSAPSPRWRHGCARDEARGVVVLHGGAGAAGALDDTWEWSGGAWSSKSGASPPRENHVVALVWDALRGRVLLVGAGDYSTAVWEWDGAAWRATPMEGFPAPALRERFGAAYDRLRGRLVLFGGMDAQGETLGDTWELAWERWPRVLLSFAVSDADAARLASLSFQSDAPRALYWTGAAWSEDAAAATREGGRFHVLLEPEDPAVRANAVLSVDRAALHLVLR